MAFQTVADDPDVSEMDAQNDGGDQDGNHDDDEDGDDGGDGGGDGGDGREPIRWVTVATFWRSPEAHIARLKLQSEEIDCLIADENVVVTAVYASAAGGIKLQVPDFDAAKARAILDAPAEPTAGPPHSQTFGACPECGSQRLYRPMFQRQTIWAALVALMLMGTVLMAPLALAGFAYYLIMWRPWKCRDCGNTFSQRTDGPRWFPVVTASVKGILPPGSG